MNIPDKQKMRWFPNRINDSDSAGEECCDNARSQDCREACSDIFRSELAPTKAQRQNLRELCEIGSPKVTDCVKEIVKVTPVKNIHERKF